ncbi:hypothetical protein [Paenibacillus sp. GCM10012303]|uniref:hypothetical protein n=1 Tax=Paenibacillus sp. GCM10012303 TaxID=3317340 RepID=UPI00361BA672
MKYRKLVNGDYSFGKGPNDFLTGTLAVSQAIKTNLLLLYGEWWENVDKGLPLFQNILGQPGLPENVQAADLLVREVILSTSGVLSIKNYSSNYADRTYSCRCTVETQYGDASVEVTF